jgi:hypothetical protein
VITGFFLEHRVGHSLLNVDVPTEGIFLMLVGRLSADFVTIGEEAVVECFKSLYQHSPGSTEKDHLKPGYFSLRSTFFWETSTLSRNVRHPTHLCIPVERRGQCRSG